jgi:transcriptional regulator with XRE-family HTH domain
VNIGERLRQVREQNKLSQRDIEARTGLKSSHLSRVENGHTVPSMETLERLARALDTPLYQLLYEHAELPTAPDTAAKKDWGNFRKGARFMRTFRMPLSSMSADQRELF